MRNTPLLLSLLLSLYACSGDTDNADPGSDNTDPDIGGEPDGSPESDVLINGIPADEHYAQFVWEETKSYVSGASAFPAQADGRNATLIHFFMMENGDLHLFYAEGEGTVSSTGHSLATYTDSFTRFDGSWSVEGITLRLDDVAHCFPFTLNGKESLQCTLDSALLTEAAVGATGIFKASWSESTPFDSEWADYL